jgi:hypothetical protein
MNSPAAPHHPSNHYLAVRRRLITNTSRGSAQFSLGAFSPAAVCHYQTRPIYIYISYHTLHSHRYKRVQLPGNALLQSKSFFHLLLSHSLSAPSVVLSFTVSLFFSLSISHTMLKTNNNNKKITIKMVPQ